MRYLSTKKFAGKIPIEFKTAILIILEVGLKKRTIN